MEIFCALLQEHEKETRSIGLHPIVCSVDTTCPKNSVAAPCDPFRLMKYDIWQKISYGLS